MKTKLIRLLCLLSSLPALIPLARAQTTAFTYQGKLTDGGAPASGLHDFEFKLHADNGGDAQVGETVSVEDVNGAGGLFTVTLDFGDKVFDGGHRWLEIAVRPGAQWEIVPGVPLNPFSQEKIDATIGELKEERDAITELLPA